MFQFLVIHLKSPLKVRYVFGDLFPLYACLTSLHLSITTLLLVVSIIMPGWWGSSFFRNQSRAQSLAVLRELRLQRDKRLFPFK